MKRPIPQALLLATIITLAGMFLLAASGDQPSQAATPELVAVPLAVDAPQLAVPLPSQLVAPPAAPPAPEVQLASTLARRPSSTVAMPDGDGVLTVAVISDLNGRYGSTEYNGTTHAAVRWLTEELRPDLVLSTGDMVAGQRAGLDYAAMWSAFHAAVTDPLTRAGIPLAVTPGNHDASGSNAFFMERIKFVNEWMAHKPRLHFVDDSFYPLYYAFEVGPALFISMDATLVGPIDEDQRAWIKSILHRHRQKPVKIVYGHVPLYPFAQGRETEILADPELEKMFNEYDVDLMVTGHHHAYYPGKRGNLRLLSMACLGSGPRRLIGDEAISDRSVAVIRLSATGIHSIEAHHGARFNRLIARDTLPPTLNTEEFRIWRDDIPQLHR